jgi:hypothetical protein
MLVAIKRKDFEKLDDISLIWACIEPTIQKVRGRNFTIKSEVYLQLNDGQKALLMFQVLYGHTLHGIEEFYSHLSYLLSNKGMWSQLKIGMRYFGDLNMMQIIEKMEIDFQSLKTEDFDETTEQHNALIDINAELSSSINLINKSFFEALPTTIEIVAAYIRNNTDEFVEFTD